MKRASFHGRDSPKLVDSKRMKRRSEGMIEAVPPPPPPPEAPIRQHVSLPLIHDFKNVYGLRAGAKMQNEEGYTVGKYPWKNSSVQKVSWMKYIKLGAIPSFNLLNPSDEMTEEKRAFFNHIASSSSEALKVKNAKQIQKDTSSRNAFLKLTVPRILELIFVEDRQWTGRYPEYVQGMDRLVDSWTVKINLRSTINTLRYYILAIEYVFKDMEQPNSVMYLGRLSPFENIHEANESLPLFDKIKYISELFSEPHFAYDVALQLKKYYTSQKDSTLMKNVRKYLKSMEVIPPMVDTPELMVTFRHAE